MPESPQKFRPSVIDISLPQKSFVLQLKSLDFLILFRRLTENVISLYSYTPLSCIRLAFPSEGVRIGFLNDLVDARHQVCHATGRFKDTLKTTSIPHETSADRKVV